MENIDDMKAMWIELNNRLSVLEEDNRRMAKDVMRNKYKTVQEKLISKYQMFIFIACVMLAFTILFIGFTPSAVEKYRIPVMIYWCIFFLFEGCIDMYLMFRLKEIDIYNSTVKEIATRAAANWRIHKIAILIGLPLALGALVLYALLLDANIVMIIGMIAGGVIGLLIGMRQLLKFMKYYHLLQTED